MPEELFNGRVLIEKLPGISPPFDPQTVSLFHSSDERGNFAVFLRNTAVSFAEYVEFLPMTRRGNHYHKKSTEIFYVSSGELTMKLQDTSTGAIAERKLERGSRVTISPNIAHTFLSTEHATAISMSFGDDPLKDRIKWHMAPENSDA